MKVLAPHSSSAFARIRTISSWMLAGPGRVACAACLALILGISGGLTPVAAWAAGAPSDMASGAPDGQGGGSGGGGEGGGSGGSGADTQNFDYTGSYSATVTADGTEQTVDGEEVAASEASVNAALAQDGGTLDITDSSLSKTGDETDDDASNFYGVNSIVLAVGEESLVRVSGTSLEASSEGSNAFFATDGATIWVSESTVDTSSDNSRGLDATYGGTVIGDSLEISTQGDHSAGAATDRGGGYVSVTNSTITTAGSGSPILYSTGAVEADNIVGTASGSQLAGMEGLNTIRIANSTLTSTITQATASDPIANGIIIYQSTSGDADTSTGERALFEVRDSSLTSAIESGSMFYLTNTSADIVLSNTELSFDTEAASLITVEGNDANNWGTAGSNGADVTLTARDQVLEGIISVDTISSLVVYLVDESTYTGATQITQNSEGSTSDEPISMVIESGSTWVVTADSTVSNLAVDEGAQVVDENGATVTIVADGQTVVEGESDLTITVEGSYSTEADTSGALDLTEGSVDRSAFDEYFGTDTTFGTNGLTTVSAEVDDAESDVVETATDEAEVAEEEGGLLAWLTSLWQSFLSLFP